MTTYYGTSGVDRVSPFNWDNTWTTFEMGDGNDSVRPPTSATNYLLLGRGGDDLLYGSEGSDQSFGGSGDDILFSYGGNDRLSGDSGSDLLDGGTGNDTLVGGTGTDYMKGGSGSDSFFFDLGSSPSVEGQADMILDWNVALDWIDSTIKGTSTNYREAATSLTDMGDARSYVEQNGTLKVADHVFLYNAQTDTGYLLSDLDRNYSFETGVVLQGAGSAADMAFSDII